MRHALAIENIEEMRLREGIKDIELRKQIRGLHVGDCVKLTFLNGTTPSAGETLLVRITSIRGHAFRGKLVDGPASSGLSDLHTGSAVVFTTAHIHSLAKAEQADEQ